MRRALFISTVLIGSLLSTMASAEKRTLTVYTYDSFTSEWGPGPKVKESFEAVCDCTLNLIGVADGVALLNRLKLEREKSKADVVLGIDTNLIAEAKATGLFEPSGVDAQGVTVPGGFTDEIFLPYDYGYFAINYDSDVVKTPPSSMKEFIEGDSSQKLVIQDPRTSTPGLGMLLWLKAIYGDEAPSAWEKLKGRILTITPGWSEAYSLFTKGEAPFVLSYHTSPAYHMVSDKTDRYQAAVFSEGHYIQIEVAGMLKGAKDKELAKEFLSFMLTPGFQDYIPEYNWMLPVAQTSEPLNEAFSKLISPEKTFLFSSEEVAEKRRGWIDEWLNAMSQR